jgi:hypothetical protein
LNDINKKINILFSRAGTQQSSRHSEGKQGYSVRQTETQRLRDAQLQKPVQRDPFKMTRYVTFPFLSVLNNNYNISVKYYI